MEWAMTTDHWLSYSPPDHFQYDTVIMIMAEKYMICAYIVIDVKPALPRPVWYQSFVVTSDVILMEYL